jgi:hypothetical protein
MRILGGTLNSPGRTVVYCGDTPNGIIQFRDSFE